MRTPNFFICLFSLLFFTYLQSYSYHVSACAIFQNESRFLKEWIEYHKLIGVEKFYLYNNNSSDDYKTILSPYIKKGIVELIEWPQTYQDCIQWNNVQSQAYQDALRRTRGKSKWLAIIDLDEFIVIKNAKNLRKFLKEFEDYSGVCANWQMFGTSGVEVIPRDRLMIEMLTKRAAKNHPDHIHIKSIVKPELVRTCENPHFVFYTTGYSVTAGEHTPFIGPFAPSINTDKIQINHYWLRDQEYLKETKYSRLHNVNPAVTLEFLKARDDELCEENDTSIFRFIPNLKKAMSYQ